MARAFGLFGGLSIIGGLLLLTPAQPLSAAKRPSSVETSLLGIRILQTYRDVLAKYGQPTRIYRSGEMPTFVSIYDANGNPTGGIRSLGDATSGPGMMGRQGGMMGRPGGMMGGPGMMGRPGGISGMNSSSMGGMMSSSPGGMGGYQGMAMGGAGMMGRPGGGMMSSSMGPGGMGASLPGMAGSGRPGGGLGASLNQGDSETFGEAGGFQWVYFYPKQELVYWFIFNKDERVVAIIERGRNLGQKTARGLGLGDATKTIYSTYGWPDALEQQGYTLALRYPVKHHMQFNITKNKVNTIAVFLSETEPYFTDDDGGGGAPGMGGGRGMGMPGMAGGSRRGGMMGGPGMMMGGPGMMMGRPGMAGGGKGD